MIDEISADPVENVRDDRLVGNAEATGGFRIVSIFTPLIDEINALPVENSIVFRVLIFVVAAFKDVKFVKPITDKDPALAALVTVREFADAAPDTIRDPIPAAVVTVRVPVKVLLGVYNEPP